MGNKGSKTDKKFMKLKGLYPKCEWDQNSIEKLIHSKQISPLYEGKDFIQQNTDECPICLLFYEGGMNISKCCNQRLCSECYLQIKKPKEEPRQIYF
jgi:hypothetical protein